jgi:hypothetical protein
LLTFLSRKKLEPVRRARPLAGLEDKIAIENELMLMIKN